ncbi:unnamed protein product [Cercospora beticola]|nr:unnamed protein product [Cercospora beticola]
MQQISHLQLLDLPDELLLQIFGYLAPPRLTAKSAQTHLALGLNRRLLGIARDSLFTSACLRVEMTMSDFFGYLETIQGFSHLVDQGLELRCRWDFIRDSMIGHRLRYLNICIRVSRYAHDELLSHVSNAIKAFRLFAVLDVKVHDMDLPSADFADLLSDLRSSLCNNLSHATTLRVRGVRRSGMIE